MAIGIICEYNPFHKGHLYHLQAARALAAHSPSASHDVPIICVMSGHYVQRGEPALLDKWTRTRMALAAGASLVIELPTYYSTATAEWFAQGAVFLLQQTGLVDAVSFGLEASEQLPALQKLCPHLAPESAEYQTLLKKYLSQKPSFAAARASALQELAGQPLALQSPNTILVLEYLRSMHKLNWQPTLLPVQRQSAAYHDLSTNVLFPSASAIRRQAEKGCNIQPYLPDCCAPYLPSPYVLSEDLFTVLPYVLSFHDAASLANIDEVGEGLENRIISAIQDTPSYSELLERLKTKRYPTARLRRILLNILLNITSSKKQGHAFSSGPAYIRVLGFRRDQQSVVSELSQFAKLPVITNLSRQLPDLPTRAQSMLQDEILFSQIYATAHPALNRDCEYRTPLIVM